MRSRVRSAAHGRPMTPRPATRSHSVHARYTLSRLQDDWRLLSVRPDAIARARTWRVTAVGFADLDELRALAGWTPRPSGDPQPTAAVPVGDTGGDDVLARLLLVARTDQLAGRIVLQRLLPGLCALSRRHGVCLTEHLDAFDELLSAAWTVIRSFPVERRPAHVAANLLRDTEYVAFKRERRRAVVHEYVGHDSLDRPVEEHEGEVEPLCELLDAVGTMGGGLEDADRRLLQMLLTGRNVREVARRMEVSERTIRNHRDLLVRQVQHALAG